MMIRESTLSFHKNYHHGMELTCMTIRESTLSFFTFSHEGNNPLRWTRIFSPFSLEGKSKAFLHFPMRETIYLIHGQGFSRHFLSRERSHFRSFFSHVLSIMSFFRMWNSPLLLMLPSDAHRISKYSVLIHRLGIIMEKFY